MSVFMNVPKELYLTSLSDAKYLATESKPNPSSRCLWLCEEDNGLNLDCVIVAVHQVF